MEQMSGGNCYDLFSLLSLWLHVFAFVVFNSLHCVSQENRSGYFNSDVDIDLQSKMNLKSLNQTAP